MQQLMDRAAAVVAGRDRDHPRAVPAQPRRAAAGDARFEDDHTVRHRGRATSRSAPRGSSSPSGTRPARPPSVQFDDRTIIDSDGLLKLESRVPRTMTVVGAGVIGVEYASMFGALGTKVTVVDQRDRVLSFLDGEIGEAFQYLLRRRNVTFRLREKVDAVEALKGRGARLKLASGKEIVSETVLYATGRQGDTDGPRARRGGPGDRQARADQGRRVLPHGGPAHLRRRATCAGGAGLAATAMEQGRIAALHAFERARGRAAGPDPDRRLRDPGAGHGGPHRGAADRRRGALRRRGSPAGASWPAA